MKEILQSVRVRFAPSPTGRTHLGSGRTALYNYLLARQTGGQFILRIEDTDKKRFIPVAEQELIESLHWLGLEWDEGPDVGGPYSPYRQSERKEIYLHYAHRLIKTGHAYYCFCTQERLAQVREQQRQQKLPIQYDGACRRLDPDDSAARVAKGESAVIRFKMPDAGIITAHDMLRGDIAVENRNLDDYILVKSDGLALYHLAAMVDDHEMKISHVIRGSEWLSTFPLHVHVVRALGWQEPSWIHLSIFLKPSGKGKMSKRESPDFLKDGYSIFIKDLKDLGYIPEGVVNWISLMGWSYDDHTEFFTMQDLIEKFRLDGLNPAPAAINFTKLDHFNGLHIRNLLPDVLRERIKPHFQQAGYPTDDQMLEQLIPLVQERMVTLDDAPALVDFMFKEVHAEPDELVGKKMTREQAIEAVHRIYDILVSLPDFSHEVAEPPLRALAEEMDLNPGQLFGLLRTSITGRSVSPPLLETMTVLGKDKVLQRVQNAIDILTRNPG